MTRSHTTRTLRPFLDAVTNELDGQDWQMVNRAVYPIDPDDFAECWSLLTPEEQVRAEPAWSVFLDRLATGERDRIDEAFAAVCEILGIDPPADDPVRPSSIVDRLPLASGLDDTQPGHSARQSPEPEPSQARADTAELDRARPDEAADQRLARTVALTVAQVMAERAPARHPWAIVSGSLAVMFVLFAGLGLREYERARDESTTLRAQLVERVLDSAPATVPADAPARMIPVDAGASMQVQWIVERAHEHAFDWRVTVQTGQFDHSDGIVIPYSEYQYQTSINNTPVTLSWGD